jgi:phytoene synthase
MADVVRTTREPMVGAIRLAWWREQLEALDTSSNAPPEPRLKQVERLLLPRGIRGHDLAGLEPGWLRLLDAFPWSSETSEAIWLRGNLLFGLGARFLGQASEQIQTAGGLWALVDVARHCSDPPSRDLLLLQASKFAGGLAGIRFAPQLRPLSMLAALAIRDSRQGEPLDPEGTPRRAALMVRHRLFGKL